MQGGTDEEIWIKEFTNDLGRLAQGLVTRMPKGKNTIFFIPRGKVPNDKTVTYGCIVVEIRPQKGINTPLSSNSARIQTRI